MLQKFFAVALVAAFASQSVQAQSLRDLQHEGRGDARAVASVTIPLGGSRSGDDTQPRLDFAVQNQVLGGAQSVTPLRFDPDFQRRTVRGPSVSLTFERNPQFLMNGQHVATFGPRLTADEDDSESVEKRGGNNTALYVIGGVLALGVAGTVILVTDLRDAGSDLIGPAD